MPTRRFKSNYIRQCVVSRSHNRTYLRYESINWHFTLGEREGKGVGGDGTGLVSLVSSDRWATGLIPRGDDFLSQCVSAWERAEYCATTILSSILAEKRREKERREKTGRKGEEREGGREREDGRKPRLSLSKKAAHLSRARWNFHCS